MMEAGEPEGSLVLAEEQMQGRGRRQRAWHSPSGLGVYASLILRPSLQAELLPLVSFAAAVGVVRALESLSLTARIKWPNDILLGGKKAGGLLAEARGDGPGVGVVVGLGLNVNQEEKDFPPELRGRITSLLLASGRAWDRHRVLSAILRAWEWEHEKLLEKAPRSCSPTSRDSRPSRWARDCGSIPKEERCTVTMPGSARAASYFCVRRKGRSVRSLSARSLS
jgi:BirA family biotin operon repressor/biotin-[acetyl-CoA-carboxylase] ligase